jgi:hypothetical protein
MSPMDDRRIPLGSMNMSSPGQNSSTPGGQGGSSTNMRVGSKMNKDKESFLPRVDSRQNI